MFSSLFAPPKVKKGKKTQRLEYADEQTFELNDPESVYIWIYEAPASLTTWLLGAALIAFVIACCFFPIWPWQARQAAYYATMAALALLGILLLVAFIRLVLYLVVLLGSLGRRRFWLFPNFFADCGFFESFQPVFSLEAGASTTPSLPPSK